MTETQECKYRNDIIDWDIESHSNHTEINRENHRKVLAEFEKFLGFPEGVALSSPVFSDQFYYMVDGKYSNYPPSKELKEQRAHTLDSINLDDSTRVRLDELKKSPQGTSLIEKFRLVWDHQHALAETLFQIANNRNALQKECDEE